MLIPSASCLYLQRIATGAAASGHKSAYKQKCIQHNHIHTDDDDTNDSDGGNNAYYNKLTIWQHMRQCKPYHFNVMPYYLEGISIPIPFLYHSSQYVMCTPFLTTIPFLTFSEFQPLRSTPKPIVAHACVRGVWVGAWGGGRKGGARRGGSA